MSNANLPRLLTVDEVADVTRSPKSTVQTWIYSGRLKALKVGRHRLVPEPELRRFLGM